MTQQTSHSRSSLTAKQKTKSAAKITTPKLQFYHLDLSESDYIESFTFKVQDQSPLESYNHHGTQTSQLFEPFQSHCMSGSVMSNYNTDIRRQTIKPFLESQQKNRPKSRILDYCPLRKYFLPEKRRVSTIKQKQIEGDAKIMYNGQKIQTKFILCKEELIFIQKSYFISEISKVKIIPTALDTQKQIKIQIRFEPLLVFVSHPNSPAHLHAPFLLFASIVTLKMKELGFHTQWNWQNTEGRAIKNSLIHGRIYKKSQYTKKWYSRFIIIRKEGIYSYKNSEDLDNCSFFISKESIKYIWTRFNTIMEHLIVKVSYGMCKTEFAVPIVEYGSQKVGNWLLQIYKLIL